jgi:tetratricopeptide (TPR) repeat protein
MKRWTAFILVAAASGPPAWAQEETDTDPVDLERDTVTGKKPPPIAAPIPEATGTAGTTTAEPGVYPAAVVRGAKALTVDLAMVGEANKAVQALYGRDYTTAKSIFDTFDRKYPGTGLAPVGNVLVWQAMMLENFDFRFEGQYQSSYRSARQQLEQALLVPGNEAWEQFLLGGMLGVDSIHTMRHGDFVKALNRGFEAMKAVKKCEDLAPDFVDARIGDGLYNYWRSVVTLNSKVLPDFGDHRAEGITQLQTVEANGTFLGPAATLALAFTWIEEGEHRKALESALKNYRVYPRNVINNLVLARLYYYVRDYKNSERVFHEVIAVAPENQRVYYGLATLYARMRDYPKALAAIDKYLSFDLSAQDRALAWFKKGNVHYDLKQWSEAEAAYTQAVKADSGLKRAKLRLEKVKELSKG